MEKKISPIAISPSDVPRYFPALNIGTLANLRSKGEGPRFYKLKKKVIYRLDDLERYIFGSPVLTIDDHDEAPICRRKE